MPVVYVFKKLAAIHTNKNLEEKWYAVYTKPRWEKKVQKEFDQLNITNYLPLVTKVKQWSDRKKKVEEPLINSYIFVKIAKKDYYNVLNVNGALKYITFQGKAVPIPEKQIEALHKLIENRVEFSVSSEQFQKGKRITIQEGNFKGLEGEIVNVKGSDRLVVRIDSIGYNLVIETKIDGNNDEL